MEEVQKIAPALHLMTCFEIGSGELGAGRGGAPSPFFPLTLPCWWVVGGAGAGRAGETKENPQANIPGSTLLPVIFSCTYLALMWLN